MISQMSLTSLLMWLKGAIQLFDVPLLSSQQLRKFKAAMLRSSRANISWHKTNDRLKELCDFRETSFISTMLTSCFVVTQSDKETNLWIHVSRAKMGWTKENNVVIDVTVRLKIFRLYLQTGRQHVPSMWPEWSSDSGQLGCASELWPRRVPSVHACGQRPELEDLYL